MALLFLAIGVFSKSYEFILDTSSINISTYHLAESPVQSGLLNSGRHVDRFVLLTTVLSAFT